MKNLAIVDFVNDNKLICDNVLSGGRGAWM